VDVLFTDFHSSEEAFVDSYTGEVNG